ncbi:MAG: SCO family protein [Bacteroidetes bacterium]|nr:SCO family protein [Bacteroidota bacterium]
MALMLLLAVFGQFSVMAQADTEQGQKGIHPSLSGVGVEEKLGTMLPRDVVFMDSDGRQVTLGQYMDQGRPLLLNFIYHNCPMLCSITLEALGQTLSEMDWTPGEQFEVLSISFGARETPEMAARARERMLTKLNREEASEGWHFLVGDSLNVHLLTDALGYSFKWVASTQEYAHPAVLVFAGEDGKVTRYLHGLDLPANDVRKALVEASEGKVGSVMDQVLMYCYQYDPGSNSYVLHATNLMKVGGMLTLMLLGVGLFVFWRRERDRQSGGVPHFTSG